MTHNILRTSATRICIKRASHLQQLSFSTKTSGWFRRFLSPAEEEKLYLGITSSFRKKLVEQSNKSTQTYSNIIEHAILSAKPVPSRTTKIGMLSIARMEQLKLDLDAAGKAKDIARLKTLEDEMNHADIRTATIYNRLIRAYLWSDNIQLAEHVLHSLDEQGLVPTTRTYTYLIQAHLKKEQLSQAKLLVEQMQHLSLLKLRNSFDCSVMLKYYQTCGDTHAIEYLWRDMMMHIESINPGPALYTQYLEYLLLKNDTNVISQTAQELITHQTHATLTLHQYVTWIKAVKTLAADNKDTPKAEQLLFYLIKKAPPKTSWDKAKDSIRCIVSSYIAQDQQLKALAFYYKLCKVGVPEQAFEPQTMQFIKSVLQHVEENNTDYEMTELEGFIKA